MRGKLLLLLLLAAPFLGAAPSSVALDDLRINLSDTAREVKCQKGDIELLHDKLSAMQRQLDASLKEIASTPSGSGLESDKLSSFDKRLTQIEKSQKSFATDFKTIKDHLNESTLQLAKCEAKLQKLEVELKSSMNSMLSLLQGGEKGANSGKLYTVKPGDSLGKIAQDNRTTVKELKALNSLERDQIAIGQKLQIP